MPLTYHINLPGGLRKKGIRPRAHLRTTFIAMMSPVGDGHCRLIFLTGMLPQDPVLDHSAGPAMSVSKATGHKALYTDAVL